MNDTTTTARCWKCHGTGEVPTGHAGMFNAASCCWKDCPDCDGTGEVCAYCHDGWVMDDDEHYAPCEACEDGAELMRADVHAELDAMYAWEAQDAPETASVPY